PLDVSARADGPTNERDPKTRLLRLLPKRRNTKGLFVPIPLLGVACHWIVDPVAVNPIFGAISPCHHRRMVGVSGGRKNRLYSSRSSHPLIAQSSKSRRRPSKIRTRIKIGAK